MLNVINLLKKNDINRIYNKAGNTIRMQKKYIPLSKEWHNSLYSFSKNTIRFLPAIHNYVFKLIKGHFNVNYKNLEIEIKSRRNKRIKRSFGNKIWISTPEIKHLNEKISITIYVYNRLYNYYKKKLNNLELEWGPKIEQQIKRYKLTKKNKKNTILIKKSIKIIRPRYPIYWGTSKKIYNKNKDFYVKIIKWLKWDKHINIKQYKSDISYLKKNKIEFLKGLNLLKVERYDYLINQFKKELIYLKLRQKMLFNEFKFNEIYLTPLIEFLQIIYKKKIGLNIVILKNYFLSSSILSQLIVSKIISIKNRGKPMNPIDNSMAYVRIPNLSSNKIPRIEKTFIGMQNVVLNKFEGKKQDSLNEFLLKNKQFSIWSSEYIDKLALKNIENKSIAGLFIKVAGRLTKRYKSQLAINRLKNRGTLKNVHSSHKGLSSVLSKGYNNINVEKTIIHSKVRIGSFGLTGWIASY